MNNITFLDYPNQVMPELCGPFNSELEFLKAFAFSIIQPLYRGFAFSTSDRPDKTFHLSHGDLSNWNILVDPTISAVTGVVDWEMVGFRPAWLAAVAPGWFNGDPDQFLMSDHQGHHPKYKDDTIGDTELCSHFRLQLARWNMELFCHYWLGPELRAFFDAGTQTYAGNAEIWLWKYEMHEWDVKRHGAISWHVFGKGWFLRRHWFNLFTYAINSINLKLQVTCKSRASDKLES